MRQLFLNSGLSGIKTQMLPIKYAALVVACSFDPSPGPLHGRVWPGSSSTPPLRTSPLGGHSQLLVLPCLQELRCLTQEAGGCLVGCNPFFSVPSPNVLAASAPGTGRKGQKFHGSNGLNWNPGCQQQSLSKFGVFRLPPFLGSNVKNLLGYREAAR